MPIILHKDLPASSPYPNCTVRTVVSKELGAASLTVLAVDLDPGGAVPLHIHPGHEEAILVLEGTVEAVLGDETRTVEAGTTVLAPQGIRHQIMNTSEKPARVLGIFPTLNVTREFL